ncbi:ABC transporter ATP-binding protein [Natronomonas marina]|uniref:ABC transporter ATP-binding protein n=1 Tax=Natronomonas marina TaxID=2961939 RepID=UPI0020C98D7F|nr:ABC transporter ATP-binding protein [Natronomonas marina]
MSALSCDGLKLSYGSVLAVDDVSFSIEENEWVSIVGPNGAGKTSLLNLLNGFNEPDEGRIYLQDDDITLLPPWKRARRGLGRTFQQGELFEDEDAVENMLTIRGLTRPVRLWEALLWVGPGRRKEAENVRAVEEMIDYLELWEYRHDPVGSLPLGIQKRISLGRSLMLDPDVILLDEIMSGLTFDEKYDMVRFISDLWEQEGLTIIMIEHDLQVVTSVSERIVALNEGRVIADGPPETVANDPHVKEVYTG